MSSVTESNLGLNYGWAYGESGWNTGMDDNLVKLGFTSRNQIKGILSAPPSTPSNGDAYIVGTSPTGLFSGNFGKVAIWDRTVWLFLTPKNHEVVYNVANGCDYKYDNGWVLKQEDELSPYVKVKDFTFSTGYTITDQKQCLLNLADNKYYQWFGSLPKVVTAGSTPATSGGIGAGAWVDRTDLMLRNELASTSGASMVYSERNNSIEHDLGLLFDADRYVPDVKVVAPEIGSTPLFRIVSSMRLNNIFGKLHYTQKLTSNAVSNNVQTPLVNGSDPGVFARNSNNFSIKPYDAATPCNSGVVVNKTIQTPFEVISVTVDSVQTDTGIGDITQSVGLMISSENYFSATFDIRGATTYIQTRTGGNPPVFNAQNPIGTILESGDVLSLVLNGVHAYTMVTKPNGKEFRGEPFDVTSAFDPRSVSLLESFKPFFGAKSNGSENIASWTKLEIRHFGGVGMRDFSWVKYEDGTPYEKNGYLYFTATVAGIGDSSNPAPYTASHQGIFGFDPITHEITQTGRTLFRYDGYISGHHAGQIIFNRISNSWNITATSFGTSDLNGDLRIHKAEYYGADLLDSYTVHFSDIVTFTGYETKSIWDAQWMFINGQWKVICTIFDTISKAALFVADKNTPFSPYNGSIYNHTSGAPREGTKIINTGGSYTAMVGETGGLLFRYSLSPFAQIAAYSMPSFGSQYGSPAQHWDVIPFQRNGIVEYFALQFDTTYYDNLPYTWGTTHICKNGFGGETFGMCFDVIKN